MITKHDHIKSESINSSKLPNGWVSTSIKSVVHLVNGRAFKPSEWEEKGIPIVRIQNLNNLGATYNYSSASFDEKFLITNGTLLFAWSGTPGTSFGAHIWRGKRAWLNQHIFKVVFDEGLTCKEFLKYAINQNLNEFIGKAHGAAGLAHITKGKFESSEILLPPLNEQRRIVAKLEELFSHLDAGVKALKKAQALLKQYRQAVLKAAVTGELTREWREQHKGQLEPAEQLLARILTERRRKWEEQELAKLRAKGKEPQDDKWKQKYQEPAAPDTSNLPPLPEGWCWATLESISEALGGYAFKSADFENTGYQVVKMGNVKMWKLQLDDNPSFITKVSSDIMEKYLLVDNDVLITLTGTRGKRDYGNATLVKSTKKLLFNQRLARLRFSKSMLSSFCLYALGSEYFRNRFFANETGNVGQGNVSMTAVTKESVALPSRNEQAEIVDKIESMIAVVGKIEESMTIVVAQAESLKRRILESAFSGQLVPQDPNDEPASVLLERIKAMKAVT